MQKYLIVIVPGSKTRITGSPGLAWLLRKFYNYYGVQVEEDAWIEPLRAVLATLPVETIVFNWSGGISPFAIRKAVRELEKILLRHKSKQIILFTKSLGGSVAEKVLPNREISVELLVYVAAPHFRFSRKIPDSVRVINVYSSTDNYQALANRVLYFGWGRVSLPHAKNIEIPNLRHSDFNHNIFVSYQGKKVLLFDLYKSLILSNVNITP